MILTVLSALAGPSRIGAMRLPNDAAENCVRELTVKLDAGQSGTLRRRNALRDAGLALDQRGRAKALFKPLHIVSCMLAFAFLNPCGPVFGKDLTSENSSEGGVNLSRTGGESAQTTEVIGFDTLPADITLTRQLTIQGVLLGQENPVRLANKTLSRQPGFPVSSPYALETTFSDRPLVIEFSPPRRQVGLYFSSGEIEQGFLATLSAYNDAGVLVAASRLSVSPKQQRETQVHLISVASDDAVIQTIELNYPDVPAAKVVDNLFFRPSQKESTAAQIDSVRRKIEASRLSRNESVNLINQLVLNPSRSASLLLQEIARSHDDEYVRERAIMTIPQLSDKSALRTLSDLALKTSNPALRAAAHNAIHELRQYYPIQEPPSATLKILSSIVPGETFDAEASIVSPVDREHVQIRFGAGKKLRQVSSSYENVYEGPMKAGFPVSISARFLSEEEGFSEIRVITRVNLNRVDFSTHTSTLHLEMREFGTRVGKEKFQDKHLSAIEVILDTE